MNDIELRAQLEREHAQTFGWAIVCCRGDRDAAEDVMQNAYLSVLEGRAKFDGRSSFKTWLFGVIRLTEVAHRRKSWLRSLLLARNGDRVMMEAPAAADADVERDSRDLLLRRALAGLSPRQREVLQLVFFHDLTIEEASRVMGTSVGAARTHYARGKERLATILGSAEAL